MGTDRGRKTPARVKLPLPMAINMTGAAVSPASQVYLFWSEPSNDSITGYQILRGPKADSLVVIEDDTGSTSTSYTDETPPAGQTHTYAVKGPQRLGDEPSVEHAHRDCAGGRERGSPHRRTA